MKLLILLFLLGYSCSHTNYSVHERNMQVQYDRMIEHDILYKNKMIKIRKKSAKSRSINHKSKTKNRLFI
jgi:hypothetical protein